MKRLVLPSPCVPCSGNRNEKCPPLSPASCGRCESWTSPSLCSTRESRPCISPRQQSITDPVDSWPRDCECGRSGCATHLTYGGVIRERGPARSTPRHLWQVRELTLRSGKPASWPSVLPTAAFRNQALHLTSVELTLAGDGTGDLTP